MRQSQLSLLKSRKASGSPVSQKRLQRRSLRSLSPERQVSHRAASWTVSCQSPTHGTIDETDAISPTAAARRHHKQRQSFSIPPAAYGAFSQETRGVKGKAARRPSLLTVESSQRSQRQTVRHAPKPPSLTAGIWMPRCYRQRMPQAEAGRKRRASES